MAESRRLLEAELAQLEILAAESVKHRRGLLAEIEDRLATAAGPLKVYRVYLLGDQGEILRRRDVHARDDAEATKTGWLWVDAHKADEAEPARGTEIWRGRRLVFSSHQKTPDDAPAPTGDTDAASIAA